MKNILLVTAMVAILAGCGGGEQTSSSGQGKVDQNKKMSSAMKPASSPNSNIAQGMDYLRDGDVRQAVMKFDDAIRENPKDVQGYLILAQTYMHLKEYNRAIDTLIVATQVEPENGQAHYLLATNFGLTGNFDMARVQAQKCVEIFRQNQDVDNFKRSVALLQGLSTVEVPEAEVK